MSFKNYFLGCKESGVEFNFEVADLCADGPRCSGWRSPTGVGCCWPTTSTTSSSSSGARRLSTRRWSRRGDSLRVSRATFRCRRDVGVTATTARNRRRRRLKNKQQQIKLSKNWKLQLRANLRPTATGLKVQGICGEVKRFHSLIQRMEMMGAQ